MMQRMNETVSWEYEDDYGSFASYSPSESAQIEEMYRAGDTSQCLVIFGRRYRVDFDQMKQVNLFSGFMRNIRRQVDWKIIPYSIMNFQANLFPPEWDSMGERQVMTVDLRTNSSEYTEVCSKFHKTLDWQIIRVQRVQNQWLWERYKMTEQRLGRKNRGVVNEKELFHGTSSQPAMTICSSEEGFDMRFSRQGLWGQANYFAVNASYSHDYSHYGGDHHEMILAKVLTGDSYLQSKSDSSLRMPPVKRHSCGDGQIQQVRYDSVTGHTNGSQVYMTYSNDLAYPAYIITYTTNPRLILPLAEPNPPPSTLDSPKLSSRSKMGRRPAPPPPPRVSSLSTLNSYKLTSHSPPPPPPPPPLPSLPQVTSRPKVSRPPPPKVAPRPKNRPPPPKVAPRPKAGRRLAPPPPRSVSSHSTLNSYRFSYIHSNVT